MKTKLVTFCSAVLLSSLVHGQDLINFSAVTDTPTTITGGTGIYRAVELGVNNDALSFNGFNVTVGAGTGAAESLVDQSFLALCINLRYESPAASQDYTYSTDSSLLSYNPDGNGDFWDDNTAGKYTAISNIIAQMSPVLVGLDQNQAEFQEWMVAMNFALSEIIADYNGNFNSLNLEAGRNQFFYQNGDSIDGAVYAKYQQAIGYIGTAAPGDFVLQTASINNTINQDVILIPVPEPSVISLAGILGAFGLLRRRRL